MAVWVEDPGWRDRIHADVVELMGRLGGEVLSDAEAGCPVSRDGSNGNEPGHLRRSLRKAQQDTTVRVGSDVDYSLWVEEGHRIAYREWIEIDNPETGEVVSGPYGNKVFTGGTVPPQPFLRPALYRERSV